LLWDGPVDLFVNVFFELPKGKPQWYKRAALMRQFKYHTRPDIDNVALKAIMDALQGVAFTEDSRVAGAVLNKWYGVEERTEIELLFWPMPRRELYE